MKTNPNDTINVVSHNMGGIREGGLTKREYFAIQFAQGLIGKRCGQVDTIDAVDCAKLAVVYTEELISELNKGENK